MLRVNSQSPEFPGHFVPMAKGSKPHSSVDPIAERLKLIRLATGMSQAAFCRLVGIETNAWNNYEKGQRRIALDQALLVCNAIGVTLDYIYRGVLSSGLPLNIATEIQRLDRERRRAS